MKPFSVKFHIKSLFIAISMAMVVCCTVKVPSEIIQPQKMENILYDYHLMQSMATELGSSERIKRKMYEQYVFDKHHVTEAEFDSSLVWYMRHTYELENIYKNLNKRYSTQKDELANHIPPYERVKSISPEGDIVNVWDDFNLMRLTISPIGNKLTFELSPDSNYHKRDSIVWNMNVHFLGDTARARAVMSLTMMFDADTIGHSQVIDHSGAYSLSLACDSNYVLKCILGHVYYYLREADDYDNFPPQDSIYEFQVLQVKDLLLSDIELMRYHRKEVQKPDTTIVINTPDAETKE
ncbi:MAG: DUF4296 domain-containing protein [Bacteroidaceae bacterium]|nr:DUF4296 domain-containing protein [Bacteroidaceae bacterium]